MKQSHLLTAVAATLFAFSGAALAVDEDAAKSLAKKNDCLKCHSVDKEKKGPSYKKISAKYKGKADAVQQVVKAMTSEHKVKMSDGTEEDHKILKASEADVKNLAEFILAQ